MADNSQKNKELEKLNTEIIGLKIKIRRIEDYLRDLPNAYDYITDITEDELLVRAAEIILDYDNASSSILQRRLSIGYSRASNIMDILENENLVGPQVGSFPREVNHDNIKKYLKERKQF